MSHVKIFVSYSHKDSEHIGPDGLLGFLKGLEREGDIELWVDEKLSGGDQWDDVLQSEIRECDIALIFISQAFLDSPYCMDVELSTFIDRCRVDGMKIFPVMLSACEYNLHPWLAKYQFLPSNGETIEEHYTDQGKRKRLFLKVRKELRRLIDQVREERLLAENDTAEGHPEINAERRNVTLMQLSLSVDTEKYDMDAEDQMEFLYEATPLVKEHFISEIELLEGHIINMSNSGNVSACFGYPKAGELDSVRAVRAALAILRAAEKVNESLEKEWEARFMIRAGIHSGMIIGRTGSDTQMELEQGITSNITQAVMKATPANSICISDSTCRLVNGFFAMAPGPTIESSDQRSPIKCWNITEDLGVQSKFAANALQGLNPIIGREQEISLITERWDSAEAGKGQFVLVNAEAGFGKSRLTEEIKNLVRDGTSQLLTCQFSPFSRNSPFFGMIKGLERWMGMTEEDSDAQKLEIIEALIEPFDWADESIVALIADTLLLNDLKYELPQLSPQQLKEKAFEAVFYLLAEKAIQTPLLLTLEDLHWMDPTTLEWLEFILEHIPATNILILATTRPEFSQPGHWNAKSFFHPIKLDQLTKSQTAEMIATLTDGKSFPIKLFNKIYQKTEGCPLFVEDLTSMVLELGIVVEKKGRLVLDKPLISLTIPDTLQESLMARIANLQGGRLIAQIGSVIGREFSFELLKAITPLDENKLTEVLNQLIGVGIIYKRGLFSKVAFIFKHALIQDALYDSLLKRKRKEYHLKIAKTIENLFPAIQDTHPELLAIHYSQAEQYEKSVHFGYHACQKSAKDYAHIETSNLALKTLDDLAKLPESKQRNRKEKEIHLLHGPALLAVKGWSSPEIGYAYKRAQQLQRKELTEEKELQTAENILELAKITRGLWGYYMVSAQLEASVGMAQELLEMGSKLDNKDIIMQGHATLGDSYFWQGKPALTLEQVEQGMALYKLDKHHDYHSTNYGEDPSVVMYCYGGMSAWLLGKDEKAAAIIEYVIDNLENYTHLFSRAFLMNGLAWYFMHKLDVENTLRWGNQLKKLAIESEFPPWLAIAKTQTGWATAVQDDLETGTKELQEGMAEWSANGQLVILGLCNAMLADAFYQKGDFEKTLDFAQRGIDHIDQCEERHYLSELLRYKALAIAQDPQQRTTAQELFQESIKVAEEQGAVALVKRSKESYAAFMG